MKQVAKLFVNKKLAMSILIMTIGLVSKPVRAADLVRVNENFFPDEINIFAGTGGEDIINLVLSEDDPKTLGFDPDGVIADPDLDGPIPLHIIQRLDVGDRLVGIGMSQEIRCMSCSPSSITTHFLGLGGNTLKTAARAMVVTRKVQNNNGFEFTFGPLSPVDYSASIAKISNGSVVIPDTSIPDGTMVLGFDDPTPNFTLLKVFGSPGTNWLEATNGDPWGSIGIANSDNFWKASFPSDDLGLLAFMSPLESLGKVRFGLSLLKKETFDFPNLKPVSCNNLTTVVKADFCMTTTVVGTLGIDTPFPISLQTEVKFHPVPEPSSLGGFGIIGLTLLWQIFKFRSSTRRHKLA